MTRKKTLLWNEVNVKTFDELYAQGFGEGHIARAMNAPVAFIHARMQLTRANDPTRYLEHAERAIMQKDTARFWTIERVTLLKELVEQGLSYSLIGVRLGCTKSAVIGKCSRVGLTNRNEPGPVRKPRSDKGIVNPKRARPQKLEVKLKRSNIPGAHHLPPKDPEQEKSIFYKSTLSLEDFVLEARRTIQTLTDRTCRFPVGDPGTKEFFFCGAEGANFPAGRPYCRRCASFAFVAGPSQRGQTSYCRYGPRR